MRNALLPPLGAALIPVVCLLCEGSPGQDLTSVRSSLQSLNPEVSAVLDTYYHADDASDGISRILEGLTGFGHAHGHDDHHHGVEPGFNMRHLELQFSAAVDPYFKGTAIGAILEDGAEMEVAQIETLSLPHGLAVKAGKFFSDFGYLNAKHSHEWDFVDRPLIHSLTLGGHGLNEIGVQGSWLAPTPFYLLAGVEALQGKNEWAFAYEGEAPLPSHDGPRLCVGWLKAAPNLPGPHALEVGIFGAWGRHQEAHDGDLEGTTDHWLDGDSSLWGLHAVYKRASPRPYGQGDLVIQAEYIRRYRDLEVMDHDLVPDLVGRSREDDQDGYYLQATYGFAPRWRTGLRWDQVGLANTTDLPDGSSDEYGDSWRISGMVDFSPSEFSRLRVQVSQGRYAAEQGDLDVVECLVQLMVSLGAHGAHSF